jgi:aryl-phospho-beta-D-glucosidase BglC (GH1 family)
MRRIHEVVDWALEAGLYVVINMHHDSSWVFNMKTDYDGALNRFKAAWEQISASFRDYPPDRLMFESINEPRFSDDWNEDAPEYFEMLCVLNTTFYEIVRGSGGNNATRLLLLPTLTCSASQKQVEELYNTITELNDKNVMAIPFIITVIGLLV